VTAKERLRLVVDELSEAEAEGALGYLARRRGGEDPLLRLLEAAPLDDEPTSEEEDASAREAWAAYGRGESTSLDEVRRKLS
jgi:hypothetical protein